MSDLVTIANAEAPVAQVLADVNAHREALVAVLPQLDAMNSYVRSDAHKRASYVSSLAKVVYHYKREALRDLTQMQLASHRLVSVTTKCRDCGGSRCYTDYNGYTHDHCRLCDSSGTVTLRFIESLIYGSITWHTPIRDAWSIVRDASAMPEHPVSNWTVHQKGKDLQPDDVARAMLEIESVIHKRPSPDYYNHSYRSLHETYTIWIGEAPRDTCVICSSTAGAPHCCHIVRMDRLHWGAPACRRCRDASVGAEISKVLERLLPAAFLTPAVREWVARHPSPPEPAPSPYFCAPAPPKGEVYVRMVAQPKDDIPF